MELRLRHGGDDDRCCRRWDQSLHSVRGAQGFLDGRFFRRFSPSREARGFFCTSDDERTAQTNPSRGPPGTARKAVGAYRCVASATTRVIRLARVVSRLALMIHQSICLRALGGKLSQLARACAFRSSAVVRSAGSSRSSTWSEMVHHPFAFAASIAARPASVMRPRLSMSAARWRLSRLQELLALRGVINCRPRWSSRRVAVESIHPKQIASSTTSG